MPAGSALFAAASAACALAPEVGWLIAARAIQGAGAALVLTLGLALLSAAFPPEKRGTAIGLFSAVTGISVAIGPLVGGAIVEGIDWEWIFWLNVPIGLAAIPLVLTRIEESLRRRHRPRPPRPGADQRRRLRDRLGARAWELRRLGQPRGRRSARGRPAAGGGVHRPGAASAGADAADALLPLPRLLGRERGDLLHLRLAVRRRLLLRPDAADGARLRAARRRPAADAMDDHLHHRGSGRRRAGGPLRRAPLHGRRACPAGARDGLDRVDRRPRTHLLASSCSRRSSPASGSRWRSRRRRTRSSAPSPSRMSARPPAPTA